MKVAEITAMATSHGFTFACVLMGFANASEVWTAMVIRARQKLQKISFRLSATLIDSEKSGLQAEPYSHPISNQLLTCEHRPRTPERIEVKRGRKGLIMPRKFSPFSYLLRSYSS